MSQSVWQIFFLQYRSYFHNSLLNRDFHPLAFYKQRKIAEIYPYRKFYIKMWGRVLLLPHGLLYPDGYETCCHKILASATQQRQAAQT